MFRRRDHGADRLSGPLQPLDYLRLSRLKGSLARRRGVEIGGQPRPVVLHDRQLLDQIGALRVERGAALGRALQRVERAREPAQRIETVAGEMNAAG